MFKEVLLVGAGGFAGSAMRYLISTAMPMCVFPWGTFTVNASGSLLMGMILASMAPTGWHLLLAVGFCGGFTTFSAFSAELFALVRAGNYGTAALYIAASIVVCAAAVWAGMTLIRILK